MLRDRAGPHRQAIRLRQPAGDGLEGAGLPAYAPDFNPVERIWNPTQDADLTHSLPEDVTELQRAVTSAIPAARSNGRLQGSTGEPFIYPDKDQ